MTTSGYHAARQGAAWRPLDERRLLAVSGPDAVGFLDRILSNELKPIAAGQGCRTLLLDNRGRLLAEVLAHRVERGFLLDVESDRASVLAETLDRMKFSEEVELEPQEGKLAGAAVLGPKALIALAGAGFEKPPEAPHAVTKERGAWCIRWDDLGGPGFRCWFPREQAEAIARALEAAGAKRFDGDDQEVLRVEQGRPCYGKDTDDTTIAFEAGYRDAISVRKCYPGQEVLSRIHHLGHVNRQLAGIAVDTPSVPERGTPVRADGEPVGTVTSAVVSPRLGGPLVLATLKRSFTKEGTMLDVGGAPGRVVGLPLDRKNAE